MENPREGWHHIAVTKGSDRALKLYVDGQLGAERTMDWVLEGMTDDGKLYIGQVTRKCRSTGV